MGVVQDRSEEPCTSFVRELLLSKYPCIHVKFPSQGAALLLALTEVPGAKTWSVKHSNACPTWKEDSLRNLASATQQAFAIAGARNSRKARSVQQEHDSSCWHQAPSSVALYGVNRSTAAALPQQAVRSNRTLCIRRHECSPVNCGLLSPGPRFRR